MRDANRKAMFAQQGNKKSPLSSKNLIGLKPEQIPKNAPDQIKICSRCEKSFDIDKSKSGRVLGNLPLCNECHAKGLKPL